jgi:hypothetical protein
MSTGTLLTSAHPLKMLIINKKAPQLQGSFVEKKYLIKKLLQSFPILYDQLKTFFQSAH